MRPERDCELHSASVLLTYFLPVQNLVISASSDLALILWDYHSAEHPRAKVRAPVIPLCITHYENWVYIGGPDGEILYWSVSEMLVSGPYRAKASAFASADFRHRASVAAILAIPSLGALATADLSGHLALWNLKNQSLRIKMKELNKGIHSLEWNEDIGCLFSAGMDSVVYVWNPFSSKYIYKISEHTHSLVGVKCVPLTHQLITADMTGMFKVWDVRTFNVIQTFNAPVAELNAFAVTFPEK